MSGVQLSGAEAMELLQRGEDAAEAQDWPVVAACYEQFLTAFPDTPISAELWFDAALAHKLLRNWPKAYELGRQAALRAGEAEGNAAWWNLGIAATMVGDWGTAREAWTKYGVPLTPGEGEIEDGFGSALVRLDPDGAAEVVWVRRICPTRARVLSVPYGERRFGEIVVHDGAATGERRVGDHTFPVFDELALWLPSPTPTWRAQVTAPAPEDMTALADAFDDQGLAMEPVDSVTFHCTCCSRGSLESATTVLAGARDVLLAAPDEQTAIGILTAWAVAGAGRAWHAIHAKAGADR
ncbi:tetratricopeptide repeat protein [Catenulispora sp. NF23]|uniref:tetratricopeptide repeat protein n=1 Tax=Catenulispora pinistramenti TaxID=2705254 RepID=UPI001BA4959E|nr:tetratricopeptide repeat protein [Catenulispora pinistramenti]MBS2539675.1 tetratricopeptide repeat protein [Catenulispora pinistramenti]